MNIFMFSSFLTTHKVQRIMGKLTQKKTIAYIPAGWRDTPDFFYGGAYSAIGFRHGLSFPIGQYYDPGRERVAFDCEAIHLGGGNTFEFLAMMKMRGLLPKLREYVKNGGILIGTSAGSILMCPSIHIAGFADPNYYLDDDELGSLGLVDFDMKPHWDFWRTRKDMFADFQKESGRTLYCLRETQGIHIDDKGVHFLGGVPDTFI